MFAEFRFLSVFAAVLDAQRGGALTLEPTARFNTSRRYLPGTNVLETTCNTGGGSVRVVDAMTLPDEFLVPMREIVRLIQGVAGTVPMRWRFAPRFEYADGTSRCEWRAGVPVATCDNHAVAVRSWDAGEFVVAGTYAEPLVLPGRWAAERRLEQTVRFWETWSRRREYDGPWSDSVVRSALALKLLIVAPSGATTAAPTTSLPEEIGGVRNWDYRFCWIRDSSFLIRLD